MDRVVQYDPGSKQLTAEERRTAVVPNHPYGKNIPAGYAALRKASGSLLEGVEFFDLKDLFAHDDRTLYVDDCCHVNRLGNDLLGRAIGRRIVERWR